MSHLILTRRTGLRALAATMLAAKSVHAQGPTLGTVRFPTSAKSPEAQAHFLRGVAALHSFWYPVALEAFRTANQIEPGFAMGHWGEAMAHNYPVWGDPQNTEAARQILATIPSSAMANLTPRERGWLDAVKLLYGAGEKPVRDRAYTDAMERLHRDYPDDLEVAAFHALALLGVAYSDSGTDALREGSGLRRRMQAGAIVQEVWRQEPNHPGAAHYILHAFDDPDHAVLALPAARRYAAIAPAVPHALHMPSHIFLQRGMWPEMVASNEAAWHAARQAGTSDFHSLHWLLYGYLQQERASDAWQLVMMIRADLAGLSPDDVRSQPYSAYIEAAMSATFLVETRQWDKAEDLLLPEPDRRTAAPADGIRGGDAVHRATFAALAQAPAVFGRGLAAAMMGAPDAQRHSTMLDTLRRQAAASPSPFIARMAPVLEIQSLEITAMASATQGALDAAIETLRHATALEGRMPVPPGPPPLIKPSFELLGEILLQSVRHESAAEQFATTLFRHPGRASALRGMEQARGMSPADSVR